MLIYYVVLQLNVQLSLIPKDCQHPAVKTPAR